MTAATSRCCRTSPTVLVALMSLAVALSARGIDEPATVPGGAYQPLFRNEARVQVAPFRMDRHPVTNAQFLEFVRARPEWRRSAAKRIFADASYLRDWTGDLEPAAGTAARPVTHVSWFAARAYAKWTGGRLPTLAEWELAAAADETRADARTDSNFVARILAWYARPADRAQAGGFTNVYGIADLHGLVWEWTDDFNASLVTGESREDTGLNRGLFCGAGSIGSADVADYAAFMRFAFRGSLRGSYCVKNLGFRCVRNLETSR